MSSLRNDKKKTDSDIKLVERPSDVSQTGEHDTLNHTARYDAKYEIPMNLLTADQHPFWDAPAGTHTSTEDVQQLEYDEHDLHLIADREIDDFEIDYDMTVPHTDEMPNDQGILQSNITPDGIIDDDFEKELGGRETTELPELEDVERKLVKDIANYDIVQLCGEDKFGRRVIICSACRLPHESVIKSSEYKTVQKFYDCLLKYILQTFDEYVDMDYVIIYFHHGLHSYNRPSYGWLWNAYFSIDRKYKKNLKAFYIVHPTTWIKFLWPFLRSIISAKFASKLIYINRIGQLAQYVRLDNIKIPLEAQAIDPVIPIEVPSSEIKSTTKFHVSLRFILEHEPNETIPLVVKQTVGYIKDYGLAEPGIFRRSAPVALIKQIQAKYNAGEDVVFQQYGNVHLAACILKTFLRDLTEPLMTFHLYPELLGLSALRQQSHVDIIRDLILKKLPTENYNVLKYIIEFLSLLSIYHETNLMTTKNLAIVFGPNLAWSNNVYMNTLANTTSINTFTDVLISRCVDIFIK